MTGFSIDEQIVSQIEAEWPCPNGSWATANWWSWPKMPGDGLTIATSSSSKPNGSRFSVIGGTSTCRQSSRLSCAFSRKH